MLSAKWRTFFQVYYNRLYDATIKPYDKADGNNIHTAMTFYCGIRIISYMTNFQHMMNQQADYGEPSLG